MAEPTKLQRLAQYYDTHDTSDELECAERVDELVEPDLGDLHGAERRWAPRAGPVGQPVAALDSVAAPPCADGIHADFQPGGDLVVGQAAGRGLGFGLASGPAGGLVAGLVFGLLRTVGPAYQFRHAELQDHLAASHRAHHKTKPPTGPYHPNTHTALSNFLSPRSRRRVP